MELKNAFGTTLRHVRLLQGLTQEDFSLVSSRTNISLLERGGTIPTLDKLEAICSVLGIHPVTLLAACYVRRGGGGGVKGLLSEVERELHLVCEE